MGGKKTAALLKIAAAQDGIISVRDARAAGVSSGELRHVRRTLGWSELQPKTYATFASRPTWRQRLRAAYVAAGPEGIVGGATAAALMKWDGFSEDEIVLVVPKGTHRHIRGATVHRSSDLSPDHAWRVDGFNITRPARTLVDLALTRSDDELVCVLNCLARRGGNSALLSLRAELRRFEPKRAKRVLALLGELLWLPAVPESHLESRLILFLRAHGYAPTVQYELRDGQRIIKRFDAAFPDKLVAVEADSVRCHGGPLQRMRDIAQRNEARAMGWQVLEVTDAEFKTPESILRTLQFALGRAPSRPLFVGQMPTTQLELLDPPQPRRALTFFVDAFYGPPPVDDGR